MTKLEKKFLIKIPNNVQVYYHSNKSFVFFKNSFSKKKLKVNLNLLFLKNKNNTKYIYITSKKIVNNKNFTKVNLKKTTKLKIENLLLQLMNTICIKLKLVGVGYKVLKKNESNLMHFKLGYSHDIFFKIPCFFKMNTLKKNILYISGNSYENLTTFASIIRSYKIPEPYKGKGILYLNEKINLKIGKKV